MPTPHYEQIHDWRTPEVEIDHANRLVRNIALTGRDSKNGYRYSEQALEQAVPLYENKPVFLDHAASVSRPHERSARDLVGSIVNPRYEGGRVRSDIQLLDTEAGRTFLALSESKSPAVGMSHVVLAERSGDRSIVEKIHDVVSVDAVVFPATTSTFSESTKDNPSKPFEGSIEALLTEIDAHLPTHIQQLLDAPQTIITRRALLPEQIVIDITNPDDNKSQRHTIAWHLTNGQLEFANELTPHESERQIGVAGVGAEFSERSPQMPHSLGASVGRSQPPLGWPAFIERTITLQSQLKQSTTENEQLREQLEQFQRDQQATEKQQEIKQLLTESKLPAAAITNLFRQQLESAPDSNARKTLIHERQQLLIQSRHQPPHSQQRNHDPTEPNDENIIATLKHQRPTVLTGIVP